MSTKVGRYVVQNGSRFYEGHGTYGGLESAWVHDSPEHPGDRMSGDVVVLLPNCDAISRELVARLAEAREIIEDSTHYTSDEGELGAQHKRRQAWLLRHTGVTI